MLRLLLFLSIAAGCNPVPPSLATVTAVDPEGGESSLTIEGKVTWSGTGDQINVLMPGNAEIGEDQLQFPLAIGQMGSYRPDGSVIATIGGRSWQSRDDDDEARVTIEKLVFLPDARAPWRHVGKLRVATPDPVLHDAPLATLSAEFTVAGPDCKFANDGEDRCGVTFPDGSTSYALVAGDNNCPAYVNETWVVGAEIAVTSASMSTDGGYEVIQCLDAGDGRRICGDSEDGLSVEECVWSAAIQLRTTDQLVIQGYASCGEGEAMTTRSCRGSWSIR